MAKSRCMSLSAAVVACAAVFGAADERIDYERDIRPLLAARCAACHGALAQKSGLRLDTAAAAIQGGDSGAAVVPGKPDDSLLLGVVTGEAGFRMPPEGPPLAADEIARLEAWIAAGAPAPKDERPLDNPRSHWSYQPVVRPEVAPVHKGEWPRGPLDAFIAAGHERHEVSPRPAADRGVLLRRVFLDLVGLPPTRDELHEFLADDSEHAYEKVVDRLLASPHYGERWGRHWMDVWRYSDWYGRRQLNEIRYGQYHLWRWRDWIVESLNADKGYDRMLVEMLAGDEIAPDDPDVLRATGYLARNWYKFNRNSWLQETVDHTAMGFLGLTLKCARCHDHKFDPLAQEDYYRFRAFFEPHDVRTDPVPGERDVLKDGLSRIFDKEAAAVTYLFERGDDRRPDESHPLAPGVPAALGGPPLEIAPVELPVAAYYPALADSAVEELLASAAEQVRVAEAAHARANAELATRTRRLEAFTAGSGDAPIEPFLADDFQAPRPDTWTTLRGRWEHRDGRLVQSEVGHFASLVSRDEHPPDFKARIRYRTTDGGVYRSVGVFFDMVEERDAQAVYTSVGDARQSVQAFHRKDGSEAYPAEGILPASLKRHEDTILEITVRGQQLHVVLNGEPKLDYRMPLPRQRGRFALWNHSGTAEFLEVHIEPLVPRRADAEAAQQRALAAAALHEQKIAAARAEQTAVEARIAAERAKYGLTAGADAAALAEAAARAERNATLLKAEDTVLSAEQELATARQAAEAAGGKPTKAVSDAEQKLAAAQRALDAARQAAENAGGQYEPLGPSYPTTSTGRRLALARWMVDPQNPRTARVAVNHIWRRHFGQALVATMSDFGLRARPPTHPELLDWLAAEFIDRGWSMKHVHRLVVTSSAYRLTSAAGDENRANAERDPDNRLLWRMNRQRMQAELVRDGLLHLAGELDAALGGPELDETLGQTSRRRSVYFRTTPDNSMEFLDLFDLANPNECYERRESVVPQQALAVWNSVIAQNSARLLARELSQQVPGKSQFITSAFEHILSRPPTSDELTACRAFLAEHAELLRDPKTLTAYSPASAPALAPASDPEIRARENLLQVLFNHNDFVTIR